MSKGIIFCLASKGDKLRHVAPKDRFAIGPVGVFVVDHAEIPRKAMKRPDDVLVILHGKDSLGNGGEGGGLTEFNGKGQTDSLRKMLPGFQHGLPHKIGVGVAFLVEIGVGVLGEIQVGHPSGNGGFRHFPKGGFAIVGTGRVGVGINGNHLRM